VWLPMLVKPATLNDEHVPDRVQPLADGQKLGHRYALKSTVQGGGDLGNCLHGFHDRTARASLHLDALKLGRHRALGYPLFYWIN
jgi:hypothetical protein